jgi:hypothetical protein
MPVPERALLFRLKERLEAGTRFPRCGNRGRERSVGYEIASRAAESKSPAQFPARAHFLIFYFTIDDSTSRGNNKIAARIFFVHGRGCSVGAISTVSSARIAGEPMSQIW